MSWEKTRKFVLERDLFICAYCLDDANQVDHVVPRSRGGADDPKNLVCACAPCNQTKGNLTADEWFVRDGFQPPPWFRERME